MTIFSYGINVGLRLVSITTLSLVVFVAKALATPPEAENGVMPAEISEERFLFDEGFNWITLEQREKFLSDARAAGFNAVVPVVWHGRGVSWTSTIAPKDPAWSSSGRASIDPLKELISRAHELGIKVYPWFTVVLRQRDFFPNFYDKWTPDQAFNIHEEGFRIFIVRLMMEVVGKYDVDGINLDYVRSMGVCKSPACQSDYNNRTQRNLLYDASHMWNTEPLGLEAGASIARWNAGAVTQIIEDFSKQARARRPGIVISVDTHPLAKGTYLEGSDSLDWANRGLIDKVFDMQYKKAIDVAAVDAAIAKLLDPTKYVLLVGNYEVSLLNKQRVWSRDASLVAELIRKSQFHSQKARAAALYEYRFLDSEQIKAISHGPFNSAGDDTSVPSADKISLTIPSGLFVR